MTEAAIVALALSALAASSFPQPCLGLELHPFISDNLVLARAPLPARLWGWGTPGESVSVTLDSATLDGVTASVRDDGTWTLDLPPREASAGPHTLVVSGSSQSGGGGAPPNSVTLSNVAFGDVFLCSGQSNMEFSVQGAFNAAEEIADSVNYPNLRIATVALIPADAPQARATSKSNYTWAVSGPAAFAPGPLTYGSEKEGEGEKGDGGDGDDSLGKNEWTWPSATCYFFGRELYRSLGGRVPVGLVTAAWGGQSVETFSSPDAISDETCGGTLTRRPADGTADEIDAELEELESMKVAVEASTSIFRRLPNTSQLWNGMIYPLINMRFAGAVWYQGEANAGNPSSYACRFPAMIADWRRKMDLRLPFYFVQLAAFISQDYSAIRNAQMAALDLPDVGYAVAIDIGDPQSPFGGIHPRRKQEVGRRLALAALGIQYGLDAVTTGPVIRGAILSSSSSPPTTILVEYVPGSAEGLHASGTAACQDCCRTSPFEVRSAVSGNWSRAEFTVRGSRAELAVPDGVLKPSEVRYNWEGYPQCALYNGEGGPDDHKGIAATPFQVEAIKIVV